MGGIRGVAIKPIFNPSQPSSQPDSQPDRRTWLKSLKKFWTEFGPNIHGILNGSFYPLHFFRIKWYIPHLYGLWCVHNIEKTIKRIPCRHCAWQTIYYCAKWQCIRNVSQHTMPETINNVQPFWICITLSFFIIQPYSRCRRRHQIFVNFRTF